MQVSNVATGSTDIESRQLQWILRGLVPHKMLLICAQSAQASHSSNDATSPLIFDHHTVQTPKLSYDVKTQGNSEPEIVCQNA